MRENALISRLPPRCLLLFRGVQLNCLRVCRSRGFTIDWGVLLHGALDGGRSERRIATLIIERYRIVTSARIACGYSDCRSTVRNLLFGGANDPFHLADLARGCVLVALHADTTALVLLAFKQCVLVKPDNHTRQVVGAETSQCVVYEQLGSGIWLLDVADEIARFLV